MEIMTKNLKRLGIIIAIILLVLACRIGYIQLVGGRELAAAVRQQSLISLEGSNRRGIIYDRNGEALVADKKQYIYIIRSEKFDDRAAKLLRRQGARRVKGDNTGYVVYSSESYNRAAGISLTEDYGAYILQASSRYSENQTAAHLIGYVNRRDSSGAAGLELMYDRQLSALDRRLYAVADVKGNILPGRGLIITTDGDEDSYVKSGIMTTVDKSLQKAVEAIIGEEDKDCAVTVLDSKSGGIAAMACTPGFNPNDIEAHMTSSGDELVNKVTQGEYSPGSVFKIVVAAAALEKGVSPEQTFNCSGSVSSGALDIGCETGGVAGHGSISFEDAFARSCNSFFVKLGQQVGADDIVDMAGKLKLGEKALSGYPQESPGHLMTSSERAGDAIGNLSIGQGETLVTPLQIARMTNIIASGGIEKGVHILMEDEPGNERVISADTAEAIGEMMKKTSVYGTAEALKLTDREGEAMAAVKTGTAEYSNEEVAGAHGWITGYTPCSSPEYVITVLVEDGGSGSASAGPVFEKIVEYLRDSGSYSRPALA